MLGEQVHVIKALRVPGTFSTFSTSYGEVNSTVLSENIPKCDIFGPNKTEIMFMIFLTSNTVELIFLGSLAAVLVMTGSAMRRHSTKARGADRSEAKMAACERRN